MDAENTNQDSTKMTARVVFCDFTATIMIEGTTTPMDPDRVRSWLLEGNWRLVKGSRKRNSKDPYAVEIWEKDK